MQRRLLGRTNRYTYPLWVRGLLQASDRSAYQQAESLFTRLVESPYEVLDITPAPALWGQMLRQYPNRLQVALFAPVSLLRVEHYSLALYSVQAHLIEALCAIGREQVDYYFLDLSEPLSESVLTAALEALELARQERQIGALGFKARTDPMRVLSVWKTHDAFELLYLPENTELRAVLIPEARARRVGIVLEHPPIEEPPAEAALQQTGADALLIPIR